MIHKKVGRPEDRMTILAESPGAHAAEVMRASLINKYRLMAETTIEQIESWEEAVINFDKNDESLRKRLSGRLRLVAFQFGLKKENFQLAIGKEELPTRISWAEIEAMVNGLLEVEFSQGDYQAKVAVAMGFPAEKYDDLMSCIRQGVKMEKENQK